MRFIRRHLEPTALAIVIACMAILFCANGCALFSQPANLTPQEKRTMQIAAVEETFTTALRTANDLYDLDKAITQEQLKSMTPIVKSTESAIRFMKAANASGDMDNYDGQLKLSRSGIDQLQAWLRQARNKQ